MIGKGYQPKYGDKPTVPPPKNPMQSINTTCNCGIPDPAQTIPKLRRAVQLLRDLADLQNGAPLVADQDEWTAVMAETYTLLEELE